MHRVFGLISPHLDDAVLSCAQLLINHPGSHVVTIFAGGPHRVDPLPEWDRLSGFFRAGDDVMASRRREDINACEMLNVNCHHLEHWDDQYRTETYRYDGPVNASELADAVTQDLVHMIQQLSVDTWFMPLGIKHPDHRCSAAASVRAASQFSGLDWYVYRELPYYIDFPETVSEQESRLLAAGYRVESRDFPLSNNVNLKLAALRCYRSQLTGLGPDRIHRAVASPETFHQLVACPDVPGNSRDWLTV